MKTATVVLLACCVAMLSNRSASAIDESSFDHLKCYSIRDAVAHGRYQADLLPEQAPPFQAEPGCTITVPAKWFCTDVQKTNVQPAPPLGIAGDDANDYLCYKLKCPRVPGPELSLRDQFGAHTVAVKTPQYVCVPTDQEITLPTQDCTPLPLDLVGWWPLDETSGAVVNSLRMGPNGTPMPSGIGAGGPISVAGTKVDNSLNFNGTDQFVEISTGLPNLGTGDLTIDAWVRTTANGTRPIVDKRDGVPIGYTLYLIDGRLGFQLADRTGTCTCSTNATSTCTNWVVPTGTTPNVADGNWHHVAVSVTRNATNGGKLYVDGLPVLYFDPTPRTGSLDNAANVWIGRRQSNACAPSDRYWQGDIDEVEIFDRALTTVEIRAMYHADTKGKCKHPLRACTDPIAKICLDGAAAGQPCTTDANCPGGTCGYGPGGTCTGTCLLDTGPGFCSGSPPNCECIAACGTTDTPPSCGGPCPPAHECRWVKDAAGGSDVCRCTAVH